ncbi:hypothetical protein Nepgr_010187 [Nepenthes gracilis]|uniref:Histidine-containing phosphotransfer protein n=1 Tax=Nepenthes gracilis TaxID=150966 RepID=A0AAD3SC26_NEPGR|nr:hypothetical protein Nepgr_010187 [Nepenthes gracilis]
MLNVAEAQEALEIEKIERPDMDLIEMQRQFAEYSASLFREGFLDSQFTQLQQLQDESNPDFVLEVVSLFFDGSERLLNDLTLSLEQEMVDFKKVDAHVHQLKGSSSSIGAQRVKNACIAFRNCCELQIPEACRAYLQQVKQEYLLVKNKLQTLLKMEQQIVAAGGSIPITECPEWIRLECCHRPGCCYKPEWIRLECCYRMEWIISESRMVARVDHLGLMLLAGVDQARVLPQAGVLLQAGVD